MRMKKAENQKAGAPSWLIQGNDNVCQRYRPAPASPSVLSSLETVRVIGALTLSING
jgi:hypothetical protein